MRAYFEATRLLAVVKLGLQLFCFMSLPNVLAKGTSKSTVIHLPSDDQGNPRHWHITWSDRNDQLTCGSKTITSADVVMGGFSVDGSKGTGACKDFTSAFFGLGDNDRFKAAVNDKSPAGTFTYKDPSITILVHCVRDAEYNEYPTGLFCCKGDSTWQASSGGEKGSCNKAGPPVEIPYGG